MLNTINIEFMNLIERPTLEFLSDLKKNNYRDWFRKNRKRYEEARSDFESFVQSLINEISAFDPILKGLEAKSCTYRINRDIRFSSDKTLYKTHLGAFIVRGGKNNGDRFAGYYIHVEPGSKSMTAGGAYMPPAQWLSAIRGKIDEEGDRLANIIHEREFVRLFGEVEGEKLKSAPKGYPKDHRYIEYLKLKSLLVSKLYSDREVTGKEWFSKVLEACRVMKPLNDFLNDY
ncbi:MAG TPA: TIGR02453 family protein [Bacteroidales bacterium]|nr:TIGR02453 family protein [Bacteroidales bacterium]